MVFYYLILNCLGCRPNTEPVLVLRPQPATSHQQFVSNQTTMPRTTTIPTMTLCGTWCASPVPSPTSGSCSDPAAASVSPFSRFLNFAEPLCFSHPRQCHCAPPAAPGNVCVCVYGRGCDMCMRMPELPKVLVSNPL